MEMKLRNIVMALLLCMGISFMVSCASSPEPPVEVLEEIAPVEEEEPLPVLPEWAMTLPMEEGVVYGVGNDPSPKTAHLKSLIDIVWQLTAQANNVSVEQSTASTEVKERIAFMLGRQITEATLRDVEVLKEYQSTSGEMWILSRKPTGWVLDVMESVLIVYSEQLEMDVANMGALVDEVDQRLLVERVENPGITSLEDIPVILGDIATGRRDTPKRERL